MTRLIDADAFFKTFPELAIEPYINAPTVDTDLSKYSDKLWKAAYERGKNERPKGKWIRPSNVSKRSYRRMCDQCHEISYFCGPVNYPYCPYCLADMREEADNGS